MTQAADTTEKPAKEPQTFREKVEAGRFVMTVEVDPPHVRVVKHHAGNGPCGRQRLGVSDTSSRQRYGENERGEHPEPAQRYRS